LGKITLEPFVATISTQGRDKHLHLPRSGYGKLADLGLLNQKFRFTITAEPLDESIPTV